MDKITIEVDSELLADIKKKCYGQIYNNELMDTLEGYPENWEVADLLNELCESFLALLNTDKEKHDYKIYKLNRKIIEVKQEISKTTKTLKERINFGEHIQKQHPYAGTEAYFPYNRRTPAIEGNLQAQCQDKTQLAKLNNELATLQTKLAQLEKEKSNE